MGNCMANDKKTPSPEEKLFKEMLNELRERREKMGKDSPLKSRKKYVTTRTNKFFEEESSIDNCTTETFYTGGSSKGKQFFYPNFNITDEKFGVKNSIISESNSRLNTPEKQEEYIRTTTTKPKSLTRAKSFEQVRRGTNYKNSPIVRNSANIRLVEIKDD